LGKKHKNKKQGDS
jgi:hypothetical protein